MSADAWWVAAVVACWALVPLVLALKRRQDRRQAEADAAFRQQLLMLRSRVEARKQGPRG